MEQAFGATMKVARTFLRGPEQFAVVRERLYKQIGDHIIPTIIDSGKHHVLKIDMLRDEDVYDELDMTTFFIRGTHTIAREQHVTIPVMDEFVIPETARECCQWCGNYLVSDKRGGCSACGGWPKGS